MPSRGLSSDFTQAAGAEPPAGPPLIGALLRQPLQVVRQHMLEGLHAHGFDDLEAAHLVLLQYPGPHGLRPSELAARVGMTKQAVNYQLGHLERLGYLARRSDPDDQRSKRIALTEVEHRAVIDAVVPHTMGQREESSEDGSARRLAHEVGRDVRRKPRPLPGKLVEMRRAEVPVLGSRHNRPAAGRK